MYVYKIKLDLDLRNCLRVIKELTTICSVHEGYFLNFYNLKTLYYFFLIGKKVHPVTVLKLGDDQKQLIF